MRQLYYLIINYIKQFLDVDVNFVHLYIHEFHVHRSKKGYFDKNSWILGLSSNVSNSQVKCTTELKQYTLEINALYAIPSTP